MNKNVDVNVCLRLNEGCDGAVRCNVGFIEKISRIKLSNSSLATIVEGKEYDITTKLPSFYRNHAHQHITPSALPSQQSVFLLKCVSPSISARATIQCSAQELRMPLREMPLRATRAHKELQRSRLFLTVSITLFRQQQTNRLDSRFAAVREQKWS